MRGSSASAPWATRARPVLLQAPRGPGEMRLLQARLRLAQAVRARIGGEAGGFAAAVMTGDRSGIAMTTLENLRRSNIAHLLAISGLHMGLLTGFIFMSLRAILSLIPALALRLPTKKIAAVGALAAGAAYLAVAGGNVATERAFIQVAVMFVAVLLDRRAVTLRAVAIAAMIVLARRPETLLGPGFQMSFAATTALVAVFTWVRDVEWLQGLAALDAGADGAGHLLGGGGGGDGAFRGGAFQHGGGVGPAGQPLDGAGDGQRRGALGGGCRAALAVRAGGRGAGRDGGRARLDPRRRGVVRGGRGRDPDRGDAARRGAGADHAGRPGRDPVAGAGALGRAGAAGLGAGAVAGGRAAAGADLR